MHSLMVLLQLVANSASSAKAQGLPWYSGTMRTLGSEDLQAHRFESCPRSEYRLGFLTQRQRFPSGWVLR
ncbi:hypothetical protein E2C01_029133 [Portunus trituberculatus]|uniref:Secreted protein n=1 Tax=Portunus trituberculatus TaxID=210409 RepID=A0A5B7ES02_PORTR|nr:hypothetical protein [Portunus trituberculatus]